MVDPRVVARYTQILSASFHEHDLFQRMNKVHYFAVYPLPQLWCIEYEEIDHITCILMDKAELKCRKLHTGEIPWSLAYKRVNLLLLY